MKILVPIWLPVNSLMSFISCKDLQNKFRCRSNISWRYIASILLNTTWCVSDMRSLEIFIVQQNEYANEFLLRITLPSIERLIISFDEIRAHEAEQSKVNWGSKRSQVESIHTVAFKWTHYYVISWNVV